MVCTSLRCNQNCIRCDFNRIYTNHNYINPNTHLQRLDNVRMNSYAHPQHLKVLNHLIYIQYGCGVQSVVIWSLIHDITMSFGLRLTPIDKCKTNCPNLNRYDSVRVDPCAFPQHMKMTNHFIYMQIWMWDAVRGGLEPQPWHHYVIWALPYPNFPKIWPPPAQVWQWKGAPICPSIAYGGVNHFIYIQYGCRMQSVVVWSLNHDTTMSFGLCLSLNGKCIKNGPYLNRYDSVRVNPIHGIWRS